MTTNNKRNNGALALVAIAVVLAGILAPALMTKNAFADVTKTIADATSQQTGQGMYGGTITAYGEKFTANAIAQWEEIDCVSLELRKVGSPTGTLTVSAKTTATGSTLYTFNTKDVSTLTGSYVLYDFCNTGSDGYVNSGSAFWIGASYSGGDASNKVDIRRSNVDGTGLQYDGTNAYLSYYDGSVHDYTSAPGRDLLFKLQNTDTDVDEFCNQVGTDSSFVDSNTYHSGLEGAADITWQGNGIGRCYPKQITEDTGARIEVDATLSGGNDLTVTTRNFYDGSGTEPVRGFQVGVRDDLSSDYRYGLTTADGVYTQTFTDLGAGSHTVTIGKSWLFTPVGSSGASCETISGVTCNVIQSDRVELTFTVS